MTSAPELARATAARSDVAPSRWLGQRRHPVQWAAPARQQRSDEPGTLLEWCLSPVERPGCSRDRAQHWGCSWGRAPQQGCSWRQAQRPDCSCAQPARHRGYSSGRAQRRGYSRARGPDPELRLAMARRGVRGRVQQRWVQCEQRMRVQRPELAALRQVAPEDSTGGCPSPAQERPGAQAPSGRRLAVDWSAMKPHQGSTLDPEASNGKARRPSE